MLLDRQERNLVRLVSSGKISNASEAQQHLKSEYNITLSSNSVRRALRRNGLQSRVKQKKPLLKKKHRQQRLLFAKKYKNWTVDDWKQVIWSDETTINLYGSDGRSYCWKRPGEQLQPHHIKPTVKYGRGSIFVWGCITSQGVGYMCRIEGRMDAELYQSILGDELMRTLTWYGLEKNQVIFQHDNDPKHKAKSTMEWLENNEIFVLDWPAQSPDLNPIEHLWNELDRRIKNQERVPSNMQELWEAIEEEWDKIEPDFCMKLIETMPERVKDVLKAKGGYTRW